MADAAADESFPPIGEVVPRQHVRVRGHVQRVTMQPRDGMPFLEIVVSDGTGRARVVWTGRRIIGGVHVGRLLVVEGVPAESDGEALFTNPAYELR